MTLLPFGVSVDDATAKQDPFAEVTKLVHQYNVSGNPGQFHVLRASGPAHASTFHIVPDHVRNEKGETAPYHPLLDTRISLPPGKRSAYDVIWEINKEIEAASGIEVEIGSVPVSWFIHSVVEGGAKDEAARDVLQRVLVETGQPLSWRVLAGPDEPKMVMLNVHYVSLK